MKRELLDLLLARSSWANGELTATFMPPFGLLAEYAMAVRETMATEGREGANPLLGRLANSLQHPTGDIRRLIARYNAMVRIQDVEAAREAEGQGRWPVLHDDWRIEAEAA
jgi:hypothetical protein